MYLLSKSGRSLQTLLPNFMDNAARTARSLYKPQSFSMWQGFRCCLISKLLDIKPAIDYSAARKMAFLYMRPCHAVAHTSACAHTSAWISKNKLLHGQDAHCLSQLLYFSFASSTGLVRSSLRDSYLCKPHQVCQCMDECCWAAFGILGNAHQVVLDGDGRGALTMKHSQLRLTTL
jgi:hypothetical protein